MNKFTKTASAVVLTAALWSGISYSHAMMTHAAAGQNPQTVSQSDTSSLESVRNVISDETYQEELAGAGAQQTKQTDTATVKTHKAATVELRLTAQPKDYKGSAGDQVKFSVKADGDGLSYQWQLSDDGKNWRNSSVKDATYYTTLTASNNGRRVRCVVTDASGASVTSDAASMKIAGVFAITSQPSDYTGAVGDQMSFKVAAEGSGLTYQWQLSDDDGQNWRNSSTKVAVYTTKLSTTNNKRMVRCVITDDSGNTLISKAARMKIAVALSITQQPVDYTGTVGDQMSFKVAAEGSGLSYQWQLSDDDGKNWRNSSTKTATYTTTLSEKNNNRMVRCVVTDENGSTVTSEAARMKVAAVLAITQQPSDYTGAVGDQMSFTVGAEGLGLTYQWQLSDDNGKNWRNSSTKTAVYTTKLSEKNNNRMVRCVVTDENGSTVTSEAARMMLRAELKIVSQPVDYTGSVGDAMTFSVEAEGVGLSYQWQLSDDEGRNWRNSSTKTAVYTTRLSLVNTNRMVRCVVTDSSGSTVISTPAKMRITPILEITRQPADASGKLGDQVSFTVEAQGYGLTYQWQLSDDEGRNWRNSSTKTATYATKLNTVNNGRMVRCVITDGDGNTIISDPARMVAMTELRITEQPVDAEGGFNDELMFWVNAEGDELNCVWEYSDDGENWLSYGVDGPDLSVYVDEDTDGRLVRCVITDVYGNTVVSEPACMRLRYVLSIMEQPEDVTIHEGDEFTLWVYAEGIGMAYRWQYSDDGGDIWLDTDVTDEVFVKTAEEADNGRLYRCVVSDSAGNEEVSDFATVTVVRGIEILWTNFAYDNFYIGEEVDFAIGAEGEELRYVWQYSDDGGENWTDTDAVESRYTRTLTAEDDGRFYRCLITDANGSFVASAPYELEAKTVPAITVQPMHFYGAPNASAVLHVAAVGEGLTYRWQYRRGDDLNWQYAYMGESQDMTVTVMYNYEPLYYRCVVTDCYGTQVISNTAFVQVRSNPVIVTQPVDYCGDFYDTAVFSLEATGYGLGYRWQYYDNEEEAWIEVDNTSDFSVEINSWSVGRRYRCVVADFNGNRVISDEVSVSVTSNPLTIVTQPQNYVGDLGDAVDFYVEATGNGVDYRWERYDASDEEWYTVGAGAHLSADTLETYSNGRRYRCVVTDFEGNQVISDEVTMTLVPIPLTITVQPEDAEFEPYEEVVFRVEATGLELNYQWQESTDGGQSWLDVWYSTPELPVAQGAYGNNYLYRCVVTDYWGNEVVSDVAVLRLVPNPLTITRQPVSYVGEPGDVVTLTVAATGYNVRYDWQYSEDGENWNWLWYEDEQCYAESATATVTLSLDNHNWRYRCIVKDFRNNEVVSDEATVSLIPIPLTITRQPQSYVGDPGDNATFFVEATGYDVTYEWQYHEDDGDYWQRVWEFDNQKRYEVPLHQWTHHRQVRCVVRDALGNELISDVVTMRYEMEPVTITAQPQSYEGNLGDTVVLSVGAEGYNLSYEWECRASDNDGWQNVWNDETEQYETGSSLTLHLTTDRHLWQYRCLVRGIDDVNVYTDVATVSLVPNPLTLVSQPEDFTGVPGDDISLVVEAEGYGLTYRWQYRDNYSYWYDLWNEEREEYETNATLDFVMSTDINNRQFRCFVRDFQGNEIKTDTVTVALAENPLTVTRQPESRSGVPGDTATFTVEAEGYGLSYRWQYNDGNGWNDYLNEQYDYETGTSLTVTLGTDNYGRRYRCTITDYEGNRVNTNAVTFSLIPNPLTFVTQPQSYEGELGDEVIFTAEASGYDVSYRWEQYDSYWGSWDYVGEGDHLTVSPLETWNHGTRYRCVVTDFEGNEVVSDEVTMTLVSNPPTFVAQPRSYEGEPGNEVIFSASATGYDVSYRWEQYSAGWDRWGEIYYSDVWYDGSTLYVNLTLDNYDGVYRCVATDFEGNEVYSDEISTTLVPNPVTFVTQPSSYQGELGDQVTLYAEATGYGVSYRWEQYRPGWDDWIGVWYDGVWEDGQALHVTLTASNYDGVYRCVATDFQGNEIISDTVTASLVPNPLTIVTQPQSYAGEPGDEVTLRVEATGYGLTYRWQVSNDDWNYWIDEENYGNTLSLTLGSGINGNRYRWVITDFEGNEVISDEAVITVMES